MLEVYDNVLNSLQFISSTDVFEAGQARSIMHMQAKSPAREFLYTQNVENNSEKNSGQAFGQLIYFIKIQNK